MAVPHSREPASTTPLTDDGNCEQLMNNVHSGGGRGYEYQEDGNWVSQEPDSRSGSSLLSTCANNSYCSYYPFQSPPIFPDQDDYASYPYGDGFDQEQTFVERSHQTPSTAHFPLPVAHTANSGVPFGLSASTSEFNLQPQVPFLPTAMSTKPYSSSEIQAPSSHASQDNSFRLTEHLPCYRVRPSCTEHGPLSGSSGGITFPLTAGCESIHMPVYETQGRAQSVYSSTMRRQEEPPESRLPITVHIVLIPLRRVTISKVIFVHILEYVHTNVKDVDVDLAPSMIANAMRNAVSP
ncbi:hypothetical protein Moror_3699 [Moniliophthora roreri MCA 2997]|uniref:Uncharacterized protein n=1 Tax=Moniliophthora roreri (strain MCA 2997) TaxID=1381753 RepID=V2XSZ2_MONRO|nr:hypothetical protein Moror_3699 [Moniliophthora roreri MCA 2997]